MSTSGTEPLDAGTAGADGAVPSDVLRRLAAVPLFSGRALDVVPLTGGMTNQSCRVTADGRAYVARLSNPSARLLGLDREAEYLNSVAAAAGGVAPPVADYAPSVGVLVVEWVSGRTLSDLDLQDSGTVHRIVSVLHELHSGPRFVGDFDMFDVQRRYLDVVREHGFRIPPGYLDRLPAVERIRAVLAGRPAPRVPCHNDLVPANLVDDGERIRLIDYEYAGNNDPCFELGNLWSEAGLPVDALDEIVAAYFGRRSAGLVARARLLGLVSKLGWALWASIQDGVSPLDVDFRAWGLERYERAVSEFDGPDLARLLEEARLDG